MWAAQFYSRGEYTIFQRSTYSMKFTHTYHTHTHTHTKFFFTITKLPLGGSKIEKSLGHTYHTTFFWFFGASRTWEKWWIRIIRCQNFLWPNHSLKFDAIFSLYFKLLPFIPETSHITFHIQNLSNTTLVTQYEGDFWTCVDSFQKLTFIRRYNIYFIYSNLRVSFRDKSHKINLLYHFSENNIFKNIKLNISLDNFEFFVFWKEHIFKNIKLNIPLQNFEFWIFIIN